MKCFHTYTYTYSHISFNLDSALSAFVSLFSSFFDYSFIAISFSKLSMIMVPLRLRMYASVDAFGQIPWIAPDILRQVIWRVCNNSKQWIAIFLCKNNHVDEWKRQESRRTLWKREVKGEKRKRLDPLCCAIYCDPLKQDLRGYTEHVWILLPRV